MENPFGGLVVPKEPKRLVKVLNDDENDRILKYINPQTSIGSWLNAIVLLVFHQGLRLSDIMNARLADPDLPELEIRSIRKSN